MVINKRVVIGAIITFSVILLYGFLTLNGVAYQKTIRGQTTAYITVIAPASIPTQDLSLLFVTPTPTVDPSFGDLSGIGIGKFVQITGTDGAGLKIREQPGTASKVNFIASDLEAFQVLDGPVKLDDIIWWNIVTPYDSSRQGWAAAPYLAIIDQQ